MPEQPYVSVCLPVYDMHGVGHVFLKHNLEILEQQTFKDFEVVISDYSKDEKIQQLCSQYAGNIRINYFRNTDPTGGMSANTNNAIIHSSGKLLKILFQDDFLYTANALAETVRHFDLTKDRWLVTGCLHTTDGEKFVRPFFPTFNHEILLGNNTIGSPSVLTIKNDRPLLFDVKLKWLMDCDYYKRCFNIYGPPKIANTITTVIRQGRHQISQTEAVEEVRKSERLYVIKKFSPPLTGGQDSWKVDVIIPAYNAEKYILSAIQSVERQTHRPNTIIVVDDGSTDTTAHIVRSYTSHIELKLIQQKRKGPNAARNAGIRASHAEFLAFLDCDDAWLPHKLEEQLKVIKNSTYDTLGMVYCDNDFINSAGIPAKYPYYHSLIPNLRGKAFTALLQYNAINGGSSGVLVRRSCFEVVGYFDEQLRNGEDWDMWLRIARDYAIDYATCVLVSIRLHKESAQARTPAFSALLLQFYGKWIPQIAENSIPSTWLQVIAAHFIRLPVQTEWREAWLLLPLDLRKYIRGLILRYEKKYIAKRLLIYPISGLFPL